MASENGWQTVAVADLIRDRILQINDGYRVRNEELGPSGVPFVRGGDIGNGDINTTVEDHIRPEFVSRIENKLTRPFDVAFITKGTIGRVGFLRAEQPPVVFAPQVSYWRVLDTSHLHSRFLYYLLKGRDFQANLDAVKTHGSMVADYVSLRDQQGFSLRLPPILNQQAIGYILGALDDKIELNRRMNRTLEGLARALFQSWFVDFDPVRAKAAGQSPPGLALQIAKLFPAQFEDSELGEIPQGWRVRPIGDVVQVVGGGTPSTKQPTYWEGGAHPFCTPKDMSGLTSPVLLETERHLTDAGLSQVSSGQLPVGTVLLSSRAPIGYLAIAETPVSVNQGIIAMICDREIPNLYVLHWCRTNMERVIANANGSTFLEISKANFRPIQVLVPPRSILEQFQAVVLPLYQRVINGLRQMRYLAVLRDALLPKLISGELRVADAERIVGEGDMMDLDQRVAQLASGVVFSLAQPFRAVYYQHLRWRL